MIDYYNFFKDMKIEDLYKFICDEGFEISADYERVKRVEIFDNVMEVTFEKKLEIELPEDHSIDAGGFGGYDYD